MASDVCNIPCNSGSYSEFSSRLSDDTNFYSSSAILPETIQGWVHANVLEFNDF